jgi:hypothetical protein
MDGTHEREGEQVAGQYGALARLFGTLNTSLPFVLLWTVMKNSEEEPRF